MKLSGVGELSLLDYVRKRFAEKSKGIVVGIGDDSAVVRPPKGNLLFTTDMMVEGVHFDFSFTTPYQLGFKLISVNISDIFAMGGTPKFVLLNFAAGRDTEINLFRRLFDGIEMALKTYKISLIGGDISTSEKMVFSATAIGYSSRAVCRSGAGVGDRIYVSGNIGDSACGLELMKLINRPVEIEKNRKCRSALKWDIVLPLIRRHLMPEARNPARYAHLATAMIDISDGLLIDLSRICRESNVGALIYEKKIPISHQLKEAAEYMDLSPLELALQGGEDYELLFTANKNRKVDAFCIGEITDKGFKMLDRNGRTRNMQAKGYQHFAV